MIAGLALILELFFHLTRSESSWGGGKQLAIEKIENFCTIVGALNCEAGKQMWNYHSIIQLHISFVIFCSSFFLRFGFVQGFFLYGCKGDLRMHKDIFSWPEECVVGGLWQRGTIMPVTHYNIRDVWKNNMEEEFAKIRDIVESYPYVAMVSVNRNTVEPILLRCKKVYFGCGWF